MTLESVPLADSGELKVVCGNSGEADARPARAMRNTDLSMSKCTVQVMKPQTGG